MKFRVGVSLALNGCDIQDELEFDDDDEWTEEAIDDAVRDWALQHVEWWREELA